MKISDPDLLRDKIEAQVERQYEVDKKKIEENRKEYEGRTVPDFLMDQETTFKKRHKLRE